MTAKNLIGQRFYIYASMKKMPVAAERVVERAARKIWSDDLAVTTPKRGEHPPDWMIELAGELITKQLPTAVIVGTAVIEEVTRGKKFYEWHLTDVRRVKKLIKPTGQPQPVWFAPFKSRRPSRRNAA